MALFDIFLGDLVDAGGEEGCPRLLGEGLIGFLALDDMETLAR